MLRDGSSCAGVGAAKILILTGGLVHLLKSPTAGSFPWKCVGALHICAGLYRVPNLASSTVDWMKVFHDPSVTI